MSLIAAVLTGAAIVVLHRAADGPPVSARVREHLAPGEAARARSLRRDQAHRRMPAALFGLAAGVAVTASGLSGASPLVVLPTFAGAGWLMRGVLDSRQDQRLAALRRSEVPTAADALALSVLAGAPITDAASAYATDGGGLVASDLRAVARRYRSGTSFPESMAELSRATTDRDTNRLYELLGHAHDTGGRLAEALTELATDVRAGLARDLTASGGKKAVAAYGPILALMVPVTVLFLMYPTLVGLSALAGSAYP